METLSRAGACYRTGLMRPEHAARFHRCLAANPNFAHVTTEESERAKHPERRFFVAFHAANPERQADLLARQQDKRSDRAQQEGAAYLWVEDADHPFWWVLTLSGNTYEVDPRAKSCSCPDFEERCSGNGIQCKHLIAFERGLGTFHRADVWALTSDLDGNPLPFPEPSAPVVADSGKSAADRHAQALRDRALLWD